MAYSSNREIRQRDFSTGHRYKSEDTQNYNPGNEFATEKRFNSENHIYNSDYRDNFYSGDHYLPRTTQQPEGKNHHQNNYSNDSGYEGTEDQTYSTRGKRFRKMPSSASLQSQVIQEDPNQPSAYLTRQQRHTLIRMSSHPNRLVATNQTPVNNPYSTRQERAGLRNRTDILKPTHHVNGGASSQAWHHQSQSQPKSSKCVPTLLFIFIFIVAFCSVFYALAHIVPLTQEIPTVHSGEQLKKEGEFHDYMAVYLLKFGHDSVLRAMEFADEHWWFMGPALAGLTVTLGTIKIMHYDKIGGPKVRATPSLHLDTVAAVLNGILTCLFFLFYNLKVKPEEEKSF